METANENSESYGSQPLKHAYEVSSIMGASYGMLRGDTVGRNPLFKRPYFRCKKSNQQAEASYYKIRIS